MKNYLLKQAIEITYLGSEKYIQLMPKRPQKQDLLMLTKDNYLTSY